MIWRDLFSAKPANAAGEDAAQLVEFGISHPKTGHIYCVNSTIRRLTVGESPFGYAVAFNRNLPRNLGSRI